MKGLGTLGDIMGLLQRIVLIIIMKILNDAGSVIQESERLYRKKDKREPIRKNTRQLKVVISFLIFQELNHGHNKPTLYFCSADQQKYFINFLTKVQYTINSSTFLSLKQSLIVISCALTNKGSDRATLTCYFINFNCL